MLLQDAWEQDQVFKSLVKLLSCCKNRFRRLTQIATHVNNYLGVWKGGKCLPNWRVFLFSWNLAPNNFYSVRINRNLAYQLAPVSPKFNYLNQSSNGNVIHIRTTSNSWILGKTPLSLPIPLAPVPFPKRGGRAWRCGFFWKSKNLFESMYMRNTSISQNARVCFYFRSWPISGDILVLQKRILRRSVLTFHS